ncbi:MAG TPA: PDZ domain-containing protein [Streptosporangiaceae bacterium]|nr:PDZ domain-containing protein [Streptosporangiaceae bacterium]
MSRRAATLTVTGILVLVFAVVGALMPVPYVMLTPGPTTNTLGDTAKGKPLIEIVGRQTYPDNGHLNFTTVAYRGGPGNRIDLLTALRGWLDSKTAVVPEEAIFPDNESVQKVEQENTAQMESSQDAAIAAALTELKIPITTTIKVASLQPGMPAQAVLRKDDEIVAVDETKVTRIEDVSARIGRHRLGDTVKITIKRGGKEQTVDVRTIAAPANSGSKAGKPVIGVVLGEDHSFPFTVKISVGDVGGPSAGLMFSLGIYDKLTPGSLTGGTFVAGTGTITADGEVGPIGGIQQKMIAAREAGAKVFLTPKDNCAEATANVPKGLRLVEADTMHDAITSLHALRNGRGTVAACSTR